MIRKLQHLLSRYPWGMTLWMVAMLLLTACGDNPQKVQGGEPKGYEACGVCATYEALFKAIDTSLAALMNVTCEHAMTFLGIGMLFFLLFHVGKFVVTIQEPNVRKFIQPMLITLFKAVIVVGFIHNGQAYLKFMGYSVVSPILESFLSLSDLVLSIETNPLFDVISRVNTSVVAGKIGTSDLFGETGSRFLLLIYKMSTTLDAGIDLGFVVWQQKGLVALLFGGFIVYMFWMLLLTLPSAFLDAFVRMAAVLILSPFVLVAWVFPPTKDLIKKLWGVFFGSCVILLFTCLYMALSMYVIIKGVNEVYPGLLGSARQTTDPGLVTSIENLSNSAVAIFILIMCMNKLSRYLPELANQFGGETVRSSFVKVLNGLKQLALATAKLAVGVALGSPTMAKSAVKNVKAAGKETLGAMQQGNGGG